MKPSGSRAALTCAAFVRADSVRADFRTLADDGRLPQDPDVVQLLLEPNGNPAVSAGAYQQALFEAGFPATAFAVDDIQAEFERISALGVVFTMPPTKTEGPTIATLDDTCGNLVQLYQHWSERPARRARAAPSGGAPLRSRAAPGSGSPGRGSPPRRRPPGCPW